jgi:hypothetical protein
MMLLLVAVAGCHPADPSDGGKGTDTAMTPQLAADLTSIGRSRILFLHHSVGVNILAGMERLDAEAGGGHLLMAWIERAAAIEGPLLAHGGGGRNMEPKSKIDAFAAVIRGEPRLKPDLAFMKLRFAHVTAPLFRRPTDLKSSARRLLGREVWEDAANVKRAEYNRRLKETFASDPVFDLARVEATGPDGSVSSFEQGGRTYLTLHPSFTDDGGHLNASGQRTAGAAAIRFLAAALESRPKAR